MKKQTALFPARLQPLHKGHVYAIRKLLRKYNVVIAIGSINRSDSNNPFSFQWRKEMIRAAVKGKCKIIGIKDFGDDEKWIRNVERKARFDVVVTANLWVQNCFRNYGSRDYKIIKPKFLRPRLYDASAIRKKIRSGRKWEHLVPAEIVSMIKKYLAKR